MGKTVRTVGGYLAAAAWLAATVWIYTSSGLSHGNAMIADFALTIAVFVIGMFIYGLLQE